MWFHSFNPRSSSSSASSSSSSSWKVSQGTCIFLQFWRPIHYDFKNSKKPFQSCWKQVGRATPIIFVQYLQLLATLNATPKDANASSFRPHGFAGPTWLDPGDYTEITLQRSSIRPNFRDFQTWSGHFHVQADSRIRRSPYFTTGFTGGLRCGYKLSSPSARGIFHPPSLRTSAKQPNKIKKTLACLWWRFSKRPRCSWSNRRYSWWCQTCSFRDACCAEDWAAK